ncbi:protein FAM221B-like isoform X2 [Convolutriloba macropyga]|uniref:protein FAM221B-like isoform X2 n=1 Tax=Convolutriloba macropyga TaxID=536237 RepID=UPI003F51C371
MHLLSWLMGDLRLYKASSNSGKTASNTPGRTTNPRSGGGSGVGGSKQTVAKIDPNAFPIEKRTLPNGEIEYAPKGYTKRIIKPASKPELLSVARAMHEDKFGERVQELFEPEKRAALTALETGIYISWRCPDFTWDCIRLNEENMCFCGHLLNQHKKFKADVPNTAVPCQFHGCQCKAFNFMPSRPEDVGEFWHRKRPGFNPKTFRLNCKTCKHPHEDHHPNGIRQCKKGGCKCSSWTSMSVCAACDKHTEQHETYFESEATRKRLGLPWGEAHLPFAEMKNLRNAVLTGDENDSTGYNELVRYHNPNKHGPPGGSRQNPFG